jgi:hypothetical protein
MTLMKSKINSLGWLKSAIYISVVGGVILSSKPAASATLSSPPSENATNIAISIRDNFGEGNESFRFPGRYWDAVFNITEFQGPFNDILSLEVILQHLAAPHSGDNSFGNPITFNFRLNANDTSRNVITLPSQTRLARHPRNHSDEATGTLTVNLTHGILSRDDITSWNFTLTGEHRAEPVPEPTTMLGTALALGGGGWLKRKKSIKQNKTKSQG